MKLYASFWGPICITIPNFIKISQTAVKISQFLWFQDGDLGFSKIQNFNGQSAVRGQHVSSCQISSKTGQTVAEIWWCNVFFQNGRRPCSWICWVHIGATHDGYLVVSAKFGWNRRVVSIMWNFKYFARLAWKCLFMSQNLGFGGILPPKLGSNIKKRQKWSSLHESASFQPSRIKICWWVWPVDEFPPKKV